MRIVLTAGQLGRRRVGRELDALELRAEHVRRGPGEQRLRASGRALDEHVPARERGDEQQLDRALLSDHDLGDLDLRALAQVDQVLVRRLDDESHVSSPGALTFVGRRLALHVAARASPARAVSPRPA